MKNIDSIKKRYLALGVREDNIDYAISAVKDGAKREHIIENLSADYRGMKEEHIFPLLSELFAANGGEFKKENRNGYLFGGCVLAAGLIADFYLFYVYTFGGVLIRPILVWICAVVFTLYGLGLLIKAVRGKYRDADDPFNQ